MDSDKSVLLQKHQEKVRYCRREILMVDAVKYIVIVCQPPYQPENGGYTCHPSTCERLTHGTVIEYFCDEGYIFKGDYKYLTCQYGEWDSQVKLSCLMEQGKKKKKSVLLNG